MRRRRNRKSSIPAANMANPAVSTVGSCVAVFGAMAPFENVVVVRDAALEGVGATVSALARAESTTLAAGFVVPAAESTHVFMSVSVMRLALSARALATATGVFAESAAAFSGRATNVVN